MPNISAKRELLAYIIKMSRSVDVAVGKDKSLAIHHLRQAMSSFNDLDYERCLDHLIMAGHYRKQMQ